MTPEKIAEERKWLDRLNGYTPGPWRIHDCSTSVDRGVSFFQEVWSEGTDILVTTEVTRAHSDGGERNMRLIAAAPDLRERYAAALDEIERLRDALEEIDMRGLQYHAEDLADIAQDALKGGDA